MKETGHRVFSVGVGTSASESFIREIADRTGGMAEFVTPNEETDIFVSEKTDTKTKKKKGR